MPVSDSLQSLFKVNLCEHDIKVGKVLGRGSFAQVYQGLWNDNTVAIKVIEYNSNARDAVDPLLEASLSKCVPTPALTRWCLENRPFGAPGEGRCHVRVPGCRHAVGTQGADAPQHRFDVRLRLDGPRGQLAAERAPGRERDGHPHGVLQPQVPRHQHLSHQSLRSPPGAPLRSVMLARKP